MEKTLTQTDRQDLLDAAAAADQLAARLRRMAGPEDQPVPERFEEGDVVEDIACRFRYKLYNVRNGGRGAYACYFLVGGDNAGWDSKVQGLFPYAKYRRV